MTATVVRVVARVLERHRGHQTAGGKSWATKNCSGSWPARRHQAAETWLWHTGERRFAGTQIAALGWPEKSWTCIMRDFDAFEVHMKRCSSKCAMRKVETHGHATRSVTARH
mmetsp:Transcript_11749/g.29896  ORF Transcript_11749/g.29896 Transcript_11749/m.29896 type:complete len:112 (+) Transcript_11749:905-1240(+)